MSKIYATGLNLSFFDPNKQREQSVDEADTIARNALRVLMMGWSNKEHWEGLLTWRVFKAVFIKRDPILLRSMRRAFQDGFQDLFETLSTQRLTKKQLKQAKFFISNCLSLLPFADISPHQSVRIPQYIHKKWQMVAYKVVPIELTPTSGLQKLFLHDRDRVFAYGLEPMNNEDAEPHLIFMGTTYPAGQGFMTQVCSDMEVETPGTSLYRTARPQITDWLDRQDKKTHVCGTSLGGSLALLLAMDQGEKLSRVDALNPPGIHEPWLAKNQLDNWDNCTDKPKVYVQKQADDPISSFGIWKSDWRIFHVQPPDEHKGPNGFADHALNYAGFEETQFIEVDPDSDNQKRMWRNIIHYTLGRGVIYWLFLLPFRYLILPVLRFLWDHKLAMTLLAAIIVTLPYLPALAAVVIGSVICFYAAVYLICKMINFAQILLGYNAVRSPKCHNPQFFEEDDTASENEQDDVSEEISEENDEEVGLCYTRNSPVKW